MLAPLLAAALLFSAADEPGIQDNSLLTEEAYNQEPGVVQHIGFFQRDRRTGDWLFAFTEEFPFRGITHQLSYTLPLQTGGRVGDVELNYRYQLVGDANARLAVAPRLTASFPAGDRGDIGYEGAVAVSYAPVEAWNFHLDGGVSTKHEQKLGTNIVWRPVKRWNAMLETVFARADGQNSVLISPAMRWAYNFPSGLQIVPAVGFPIGVGPSAGERAVILYLSFEK